MASTGSSGTNSYIASFREHIRNPLPEPISNQISLIVHKSGKEESYFHGPVPQKIYQEILQKFLKYKSEEAKKKTCTDDDLLGLELPAAIRLLNDTLRQQSYTMRYTKEFIRRRMMNHVHNITRGPDVLRLIKNLFQCDPNTIYSAVQSDVVMTALLESLRNDEPSDLF